MMYARRQQVKEAAVEKSADTRWALEGKNYRSHGNAYNHVLNMVLITDARFEMSPKAQACVLQGLFICFYSYHIQVEVKPS